MAIPPSPQYEMSQPKTSQPAPPATFTALCPTLRIVQPTSLHALQPAKETAVARQASSVNPQKLTHDRSFARISDSARERTVEPPARGGQK